MEFLEKGKKKKKNRKSELNGTQSFFLGSLYHYLNSNEKISWDQRNQFVFEITEGI